LLTYLGRITLPDDDSKVSFLKAVLELKREHGDNEDFFTRHITLPGGVNWFTFHHPTLFVRDFYDELFTKGFNRFGNLPVTATAQDRYGNPSKFFVIGTPGIAKSSFGVYLVARALFMGKTVVYHPGKEAVPQPIVFNPVKKTVELCGGKEILVTDIPELNDPNTVYISDIHEPETVDAWTATITSPMRNRWHEKSKLLDSRLVFFSAFTWDEIQEFSSLGLATASKEEIEARFVQWGGNVRYVCMAEDGVQSESLANALGALRGLKGLSDLATFSPETEQRDQVAHRIMHFQINRDIDPDPEAWVEEGKKKSDQDKYLTLFKFCRVFLPTPYIKNALLERRGAATRSSRLSLPERTVPPGTCSLFVRPRSLPPRRKGSVLLRSDIQGLRLRCT
jgi:hypothetical protein